jgi:hypothetical protein
MGQRQILYQNCTARQDLKHYSCHLFLFEKAQYCIFSGFWLQMLHIEERHKIEQV